ncbi:uncharacterized protein LOC112050321 [Bicyclus anynana]|uniref:Uncharacterized protein LOC112050321 n=1 Tax=Bicyclus anynana TaxID=110368 RepID=A0ABM3LG49_BICAN|nr:uncharacterized protein LOC112050321 [Bicyclus anynana]
MEVSNEIKEDIRKTQSDLKNAIRIHQIWVARLQENENNVHVKNKVVEAEKDIVSISHAQKLVVDRLRRELELYQQRLRVRNRQVNVENDNKYVAQQLRDHQLQYRNRNRTSSLLKPSVLNEIQIKTENINNDLNSISDSDNENKYNEKENTHNSERDERDKYQRSFAQLTSNVHDSRNNFANALNKVKESFNGNKIQDDEWHEAHSDSDSSQDISPTPSPPPLPEPGEPITKEVFMRLIGLITPTQKDILERKRNERRKRSANSTNKNDLFYSNYEMFPKRKKYNQFPYLQSHSDPPQTRSAKLRKQQSQNKSSREGSPSGSSSENKAGWSNSKPAWVTSLPVGLSVEPVVYAPTKKVCHGCGRNDVPSLLVWCAACAVWQHTGCGAEGCCASCGAPLPDPAACASAPPHNLDLYRDKLAERKRLQERNIELCEDLRKLEARAASLKDNLDEHNAEKRQLLADQIKTQRNLHKLLDFISQFKETSIRIRSTSVSESGSEVSKSNEE